MATPETKTLFIVGATGKQGKKLVEALLTTEAQSPLTVPLFTIIALTRNTSSPSAKSLAHRSPTIKLVKGNLDDVPACFEAAQKAADRKPIWGVFSVQQAVNDGATQEREMKQGKAMVDGAIAHGVRVFVYSSIDRGGAKSDTTPTYVPQFASKHDIEMYLKEKAAQNGNMIYTILRPTAFMDALTPNFMGKMFATIIKTSLMPSKSLAYIATTDIGYFAAQAFLQPENPDYKNQAISLAGDNLTFEQLNRTFADQMGYAVPTTFGFLAEIVKWMVKEMGIMMRWFDEEGFGNIDIANLKKMHPGLMTYGDWLEKEGQFPVK